MERPETLAILKGLGGGQVMNGCGKWYAICDQSRVFIGRFSKKAFHADTIYDRSSFLLPIPSPLIPKTITWLNSGSVLVLIADCEYESKAFVIDTKQQNIQSAISIGKKGIIAVSPGTSSNILVTAARRSPVSVYQISAGELQVIREIEFQRVIEYFEILPLCFQGSLIVVALLRTEEAANVLLTENQMEVARNVKGMSHYRNFVLVIDSSGLFCLYRVTQDSFSLLSASKVVNPGSDNRLLLYTFRSNFIITYCEPYGYEKCKLRFYEYTGKSQYGTIKLPMNSIKALFNLDGYIIITGTVASSDTETPIATVICEHSFRSKATINVDSVYEFVKSRVKTREKDSEKKRIARIDITARGERERKRYLATIPKPPKKRVKPRKHWFPLDYEDYPLV